MPSVNGHRPSTSISQNQKAVLANAYNELGKELSSTKIRVVGNYTLGRVIGEGSYGKVRLGTHRLTGTRVAIKHIPKAMSAALTREIHHHRQLHHPHITQMYEVIATENSIWIVSELCLGGELFDYLVEKGRLSETETKAIFGQLCLSVNYLHEKGVVHRDLKLENVLLDEHCRVKLGDFGFTREWERGTWMETFCGTTGYAAPEMLQCKRYQGPEVDIWSLGVILYCLLTGALPFDDDDEDVMKSMIIEGSFEDPEWLSAEARDLLKSILVIDPMKRFTITQILSHNWFTTISVTPPTPLPELDEEAEVGEAEPSEPSTPVDQKTFKRRSTSSSILPPPPHTVRTPARTKRRSMSSALSSPDSSDDDEVGPVPPSPMPIVNQPQADFASLVHKKPPLIFSTDRERDLLNSLSLIGLDTGQVVHSVLTDACDSCGAIWWMLSRKWDGSTSVEVPPTPARPAAKHVNMGMQTDPSRLEITPLLSFVPPTPTAANRPITPPPPRGAGSTTPLLTPSSSSLSHHSSPGVSPSNSVGKTRKGRSGSVSIMQRATTALEAAGLVRKKSSEAMKDMIINSNSALSTPHPVPPLPNPERKSSLGSTVETGPDSPRSSSGGNKLTKSPPLKPLTSTHPHPPSTPPPGGSALDTTVGSPWVLTAGPSSSSHHDPHGTPTPSMSKTSLAAAGASASSPSLNSAVDQPAQAAAGSSGNGSQNNKRGAASNTNSSNTGSAGRNRANLLAAFKLWFGDGDSKREDKKGKRKAAASGQGGSTSVSRSVSTSGVQGGTVKRRTSGGGGRSRFTVGGRGRHRTGHSQRPSISSRRSSSVNSRRSSIASVQMIPVLEHSPSQQAVATTPSRRTHTPSSSRPSSVRSFQMHSQSQQQQGGVHRKSPSASSVNSTHRAQSPRQRYHQRAGSGSSHTKVVRSGGAGKSSGGSGNSKRHGRNNSATSSIASSRRNSWYDRELPSDGDSISRLSFGTKDDFSKSGTHHHRSASPYKRKTATSFVAQKRTAPFMSPSSSGGSIGRSSWKKSWGLEPPGWQTRSINTQQAHSSILPIEVLAISPADSSNIRDVFTNKVDDGDEDDWVDEDEFDFTAGSFVGGLGQMGMKTSSPGGMIPGGGALGVFGEQIPSSSSSSSAEGTVMLSAVPRHNKRGGKQKANQGSTGGSPAVGQKPLPSNPSNENPTSTFDNSRRQLPAGRARPPIVLEEDEDEEE